MEPRSGGKSIAQRVRTCEWIDSGAQRRKDRSPGRQPWVDDARTSSPEGAAEPIDLSPLRGLFDGR